MRKILLLLEHVRDASQEVNYMKSLTAFALCDRIKLKSDIIFKTYMDTPVTLF